MSSEPNLTPSGENYRISMAKYDIHVLPRNRSAIKRQKVTPKRFAAVSPKTDYRDLYAGLIRLHVLHHAAKETRHPFAASARRDRRAGN
jgi:hypothetical protein